MRPRTIPRDEAFDRLPVHLQQALLVTANILRRIAATRLDKATKDGQLNTVPQGDTANEN